MTRYAPRSRRAFTLIELMVSIAMVLIIILGVNAIFRMASDTINAGQALSAADRENRSATSVLYDDFRTAVITNGPMLLIRSERVAAFRNLADQQADLDFDPNDGAAAQELQIRSIDIDGNNTEGETGVAGEFTPVLVSNSRNHRIDRVSFFSNHLYQRQTGTESSTSSQFVDVGSSNEAYIWIGHLDQPDFGSPLTGGASSGRFQHRSPGELPKERNPNNFYATDWILGRSVTLLREQPAPAGVPNPPNYFDYQPGPPSDPNLSPLSPRSQAIDLDAKGARDNFSWSRYDLAQTSINNFRQTLLSHIAAKGLLIDPPTQVWYEVLGGEYPATNSARFQGYPYPDRPLTAYGLARTVPVFVRGCTNFTVEYAGDYLGQDVNNGAIVSTYVDGPQGVDGQVDFMYVVDVPYPNAPPAAWQSVRRTRWYGMPRNVDTRDDGAVPTITGGAGSTPKHENMYDVIPLRDLLIAAGDSIPANFFEHFEGLPAVANYTSPTAAIDPDPKKVRYYAAWGPADLAAGSMTRPKMIRITMTVDDPNGRMSEGQTYEYVIELP